MISPATLARLAGDPLLTSDGLRLIIYVDSLGEGEHEVPADVLKTLLRCRGDRPIYEARGCAERYGLRWRPGGKGHHNRYEWVGAGDDLKDRSAGESTNKSDSSARETTQTGLVGAGDDLSAPQLVSEIGSEIDHPAGARVSFDLDPEADAVITDELRGCRGTLRDYLRSTVQPRNQYGYVQTVKGWIAGLNNRVFVDGSGAKTPIENRTAIVAAALNEMMATSEINADGKPMKFTKGDVRNLQTKLEIMCNPYPPRRPRPTNGERPAESKREGVNAKHWGRGKASNG